MHMRVGDAEKEIDLLKAQRADNWREITRMKDQSEMRQREAASGTE